MCGIGLSAPCEIIILEDKKYAPITFFILTPPPRLIPGYRFFGRGGPALDLTTLFKVT